MFVLAACSQPDPVNATDLPPVSYDVISTSNGSSIKVSTEPADWLSGISVVLEGADGQVETESSLGDHPTSAFEAVVTTAGLADGKYRLHVNFRNALGKIVGVRTAIIILVNKIATIQPDPESGTDPGENPGDNPGQDPGDEPGEDPGDNPGQDPGDKPGDDPKPGDGDGSKLKWAPPTLSNPTTVKIPRTGGLVKLDPNRDYILEMPNEAVQYQVAIRGGRNVVLVGGEIYIPWQGSDSSAESHRRGMIIVDVTGTIHVEGLLIHGSDIAEGIQINAPKATVQLQNIRVWGLKARDQAGFTDSHPDLIQTWGSVGELRIDGFSGRSDYQGFFFKADYNGAHGDVHISRTNIVGDSTARYLLWLSDKGGRWPNVTLDNFYISQASGRSFGKSVWPDVSGGSNKAQVVNRDGREFATWPSLPVDGGVHQGIPASGDFVTEQMVGLGYVSPGYN